MCSLTSGPLPVLLSGKQAVEFTAPVEVVCNSHFLAKKWLQDPEEERPLRIHQVEFLLPGVNHGGTVCPEWRFLSRRQYRHLTISASGTTMVPGAPAMIASGAMDSVPLPGSCRPVLCPEMGDLVAGLADVTGLLHHLVIGIGHCLVSVRVPGAEDEPAVGHDKGIVDNGQEPLFDERDDAENPFPASRCCR